LWTYARALKALPYLRAIVRSVRERWLDLRRLELEVRRRDARPGRPDRTALILRAEGARDAELAEDRLNEALRELEALDVRCLDPAGGVALLPFLQGEDLAWLVFELFAPTGLTGWRYHADPMATRRPLPVLLDPVPVDAVFASGTFDPMGVEDGQRPQSPGGSGAAPPRQG
jgi:hypothetical protein